MKTVMIYTDGCALGNPGRSGMGAVLIYGDTAKEIKMPLGKSTNNRAELQAVIIALQHLHEGCEVHIYSDSQITERCGSGEYNRNSNLDLWKIYEKTSERHVIIWNWIRKDSHHLNKRAHELANEAAVMVRAS